METKHFDFLVIGAGSGGVRAARMAGATGCKVAIVESHFYGGTCVNVGCVPKKLLVQASQCSQQLKDALGFGWANTTESATDFSNAIIQWPVIRDRVQAEVQRLNGLYLQTLQKNNVEVIDGHARFIANKTVEVNGDFYSADKILIATGSSATVPANINPELVSISDDLFVMDSLPQKCLVVGAGYIAVEFAGILNSMGCNVDIACRKDTPLRSLDHDLIAFLMKGLQDSGLVIRTNTEVNNVECHAGKYHAFFNDGSEQVYDRIFYATGRIANTANLGLENTDINTGTTGAIPVDSNYQTNVEGVFAVGDVIGREQLTPVALRQAMIVVKNNFDSTMPVEENTVLPTAIFSQPELATVGLSETQACEQYNNVDIYLADFKPLSANISGNPYRCMVKLLVDADTNKVIGAHMGGYHAAEVIQAIAIAIESGASKQDVDRTLGIHPSVAEEFVSLRSVTRSFRR